MNGKSLANLSLLELCQYYQEKQKSISVINSMLTFQGDQSCSRRAGFSRSSVRLPPIQRNNSEMSAEMALRRTPGKRQGYLHTDQYLPVPSSVNGRPIVPHITKRREHQECCRGNISDPVGRSYSDKTKSSQPPSCRVKRSTDSHSEKNAREPHERDEYYQETGKVQDQARQMRQNQSAKCRPTSMPQVSSTPTRTVSEAMDSGQKLFLSPSQQMKNYQTDGFQFGDHAGGIPTKRISMLVCFQNGGEEERVPRTRVRRHGICEVTDAALGNRTFVRVLRKRF